MSTIIAGRNVNKIYNKIGDICLRKCSQKVRMNKIPVFKIPIAKYIIIYDRSLDSITLLMAYVIIFFVLQVC